MLNNVHIITDSCAHFPDTRLLQRYPITVVPNQIIVGGKRYQDGIDLSPEEAVQAFSDARYGRPSTLVPPSVADYIQVYNRVARHADAILSIHASREMSSSWSHARQAIQQLSGHCEIALIDSKSLCAGQGMLVRAAAEMLTLDVSFEELVRKVRGAVERIYSVYYVESVQNLMQNKILSSGHGILSAMLGIKPFLTVEDGQLMPIEKVRTRLQAVERIVEFVTEFENMQDAVILQYKNGMTEQTRMLQERLAIEFPERTFPYMVYNAALASLVGKDASGFVLMEDETDGFEDDF